MLDHLIDHTARQRIAASILGPIDDRGYCVCPGMDLHSNRSAPARAHRPGRDCRVYLGASAQNPRAVPTTVCVHTSCQAVVAEVNHKLRSEIARHEALRAKEEGYRFEPAKQVKRTREQIMAEHEEERAAALAARAEKARGEIVERWAWGQADMWEESVPLPTTMLEEARALVGLFEPDDVVWCGLHADSISEEDALDPQYQRRLARVKRARPFREAREWITGEKMPGPRICPTAFKPGALSRSAANVVARRFLVLEHDEMSLAEQGAVIRWLRDKVALRLRAVVFTGGKSLHAWFDYPKASLASELMTLLAGRRKATPDGSKALYTGGMGYDPACFRALMPYRAPGCPHEKSGGVATLWYLGGAR